MVIPKVLQNDVITWQWTPTAKVLLVFKLEDFRGLGISTDNVPMKKDVFKHDIMESPPKSEQIIGYFVSGFATMMS